MTPTQKIKKEILLSAAKDFPDEVNLENGITDENVDQLYDALSEADLNQEYESDFRHGELETGLPCDWDRNYESKSVGMKMSDGSWIGWTFWYGGGKHGYPSKIPWMEYAYDLEVTEYQKLVTIKEFKKIT